MEVLTRSHLKMRVWERGAGWSHSCNFTFIAQICHQLSGFCLNLIVFSFFAFSVYVALIGATLACGTGACAVVVAAVLEDHAGRVSILSLRSSHEKFLILCVVKTDFLSMKRLIVI